MDPEQWLTNVFGDDMPAKDLGVLARYFLDNGISSAEALKAVLKMIPEELTPPAGLSIGGKALFMQAMKALAQFKQAICSKLHK